MWLLLACVVMPMVEMDDTPCLNGPELISTRPMPIWMAEESIEAEVTSLTVACPTGRSPAQVTVMVREGLVDRVRVRSRDAALRSCLTEAVLGLTFEEPFTLRHTVTVEPQHPEIGSLQ